MEPSAQTRSQRGDDSEAGDSADDASPGGLHPSFAPDAAGYWDGIGAAWTETRPQPLWREFSDRHQWTLVRRWIGGAHAVGDGGPRSPLPAEARLLKTDLFDEVAGGGLVARLAATGLRVTGIDVSPRIVVEAVARNAGLEAIVADVRRLPFADGAFDAVFSGSTLDHFESKSDIVAALVELRRVLRPGGRLVLTMDNPAHPLIRMRNGRLLSLLRRSGVVPYQVGATLGPGALASAVGAAGFDVVEQTAVLHCPRVLAVAAASAVERLPRRCHGAFLRGLAACERLESLPTRWLTGHYLAVCAVAGERSRPGAPRCA